MLFLLQYFEENVYSTTQFTTASICNKQTVKVSDKSYKYTIYGLGTSKFRNNLYRFTIIQYSFRQAFWTANTHFALPLEHMLTSNLFIHNFNGFCAIRQQLTELAIEVAYLCYLKTKEAGNHQMLPIETKTIGIQFINNRV